MRERERGSHKILMIEAKKRNVNGIRIYKVLKRLTWHLLVKDVSPGFFMVGSFH